MNSKHFAWKGLIAMLGLAVVSAVAHADIESESRVSESAFFSQGGRVASAPDRVSTDEYIDTKPAATPSKSGTNSTTGTRGAQQKADGRVAQSPNTDFWFYTADVELFNDDDRDGYFHGIDLLFDADTNFVRAEVYAVVYLSLEGGPWLEYAETETFAIWGTSATDEYVVVSELLAGYPAGSYDVLIELFDAWDDRFVADFGPENTSELAFLPLEDAGRDAPAPPTTVVVSSGGGGAADTLTLVMLALLAVTLVAVRRRRPVPERS